MITEVRAPSHPESTLYKGSNKPKRKIREIFINFAYGAEQSARRIRGQGIRVAEFVFKSETVTEVVSDPNNDRSNLQAEFDRNTSHMEARYPWFSWRREGNDPNGKILDDGGSIAQQYVLRKLGGHRQDDPTLPLDQL